MRRLALLAALPLIASPLGAVGQAAPARTAATADSTSPLRLWMPKKVYGFRAGKNKAYLAAGVSVIAQGAPFELWASRSDDYETAPVVEWRNGTDSVRLPSGVLKGLGAVRRFATMTISKDGKVVAKRTKPACLADWDSQRVEPDAVARSPYPVGCVANPYALGSVQGIPAGYGVQLRVGHGRVDLRPGRYQVKVSIRADLVAAMGISPTDATATSTLVIPRKGDENHEWFREQQPRTASPQPAAQRPTGPQRAAVAGPLPDLRALPSWQIGLNRKKTHLRFAATLWNAGSSPLVVDGFRNATDDSVMDAYQYFFDADGNQTGYQQVGTMLYHGANHQHWHYQDLVRYSLVDSSRNNVATSRKISFCLANTDAVDLTVPGAAWRDSQEDLGSACGGQSALAVRQQLSAGHGDTYMQFRAGQALPIAKLPNGTYYVKIEANPFGRIVESDSTNNVTYRRIRLAGKGENRRVLVPQVGMIDEGAVEYWY